MLSIVLLALTGLGCNDVATEAGGDQPVAEQAASPYPQVITESGEVIEVEVVSTPEARARGLMYRRVLPENHGMVFLFDQPSVHTFWMRNTLIPLDMIWLDTESRVIEIVTAQPCYADPCPSYGPEDQAAWWVLEIGGGEAERLGIEVGSTLRTRNVDMADPPANDLPPQRNIETDSGS